MALEEKDVNLAFSIIGCAGSAKASALEAVECARKGDFETAETRINEAVDALTQAHQVQTDMIFAASRGEDVPINIFMVHAQDHLSMATSAIENAREFVNLYRLVAELKK